MTDTVLLENIIKQRRFTKSYIAEYLGLSRYGLIKKLNNVTEFKASEIAKLCLLLGIDAEQREAIFFNL
jgi:transcriptional regulator with XRE-family HTH domain